MSEYVVATDTASDLPCEIAQELNIFQIPMKFEIEGETYRNYPDGREYDLTKFYNKLREGSSAITAQVSNDDFVDFAEPILKEGKDILYISLSSGLSGTFQSCKIFAEDLMQEYPGRKIICIDSKGASIGQGLLTILTAKKKQEGLNIEELAEWTEEKRPQICFWVSVDDLNHLKRGGRISSLTAVIGTALGIKPIIHVDNEGNLVQVDKARGTKKAMEVLLNRMKETSINPEEQDIFIGHGDSSEVADMLAEMVKKELKVKSVTTGYIGPVIGAHSGPGTIALFFVGTKR